MRAARRLAVLALSLGLVACPLPPDPDALPAAAIPLALRVSRVDALDCKRNDCTDWYRVQVPGKGTLAIEIRPDENAPDAMVVNATLLEPAGRELARTSATRSQLGRPELRINAPVSSGTHVFAVDAHDTRRRIDYRVTATFQPAPPPPRPPEPEKFRTLSTAVLEVEGKRSVLLEAGASSGVRSGQGGKLIEKGRVIGEIVITEVYNDGCKARIEGGLSGTITPRTRAEIRVPNSR